MGFSNNEQLRELFSAGGMGFLLGGYYDVFRVLRYVLRAGKWATFLCDCLYFASSAVCVFLFSLAMTGGVVRGYVLLGILIGFSAYRYTVGKTVLRFVRLTANVIRRISSCVRRVTARLVKPLREMLEKAGEKWRKVLKKVCFFSKKGLQVPKKV